jgi:folate-dependent tRNA-U54 methylase TrmFO/GidA
MNVAFGLFPPLQGRISKKFRGEHYARRALAALGAWIGELSGDPALGPS